MYMIEASSQLLVRVRDDESGVATVEYAIMLVLIAIAVAAFGTGLSGAVTNVFYRTWESLIFLLPT